MYNILIGIFFIIGGSMVLRGTDSSAGLAVIGLVLVVWGIFQVSSSSKPRTTRRRTTVSRGSQAPGHAQQQDDAPPPTLVDTKAQTRCRHCTCTPKGGPLQSHVIRRTPSRYYFSMQGASALSKKVCTC